MQERKKKTFTSEKLPVEREIAREGNQSRTKTWQHLILTLFLVICIIAYGTCSQMQPKMQEWQKRGDSETNQVRANFQAKANANSVRNLLYIEKFDPSLCTNNNRVLQRSIETNARNAKLQDGRR